MRLHHEELTFFLPASFLLVNAGDRACPGRSRCDSEGRDSPGRVLAAGGEVGALRPSHVLKLQLLLDVDPKARWGPRLRPPASPALHPANKKRMLLVTLAVKFPNMTLSKRHSWNILFPFVCCKMCFLYDCTRTQTQRHMNATHTHTHPPVDTRQVADRGRTLP